MSAVGFGNRLFQHNRPKGSLVHVKDFVRRAGSNSVSQVYIDQADIAADSATIAPQPAHLSS